MDLQRVRFPIPTGDGRNVIPADVFERAVELVKGKLLPVSIDGKVVAGAYVLGIVDGQVEIEIEQPSGRAIYSRAYPAIVEVSHAAAADGEPWFAWTDFENGCGARAVGRTLEEAVWRLVRMHPEAYRLDWYKVCGAKLADSNPELLADFGRCRRLAAWGSSRCTYHGGVSSIEGFRPEGATDGNE